MVEILNQMNIDYRYILPEYKLGKKISKKIKKKIVKEKKNN
jgi:hypothetical protein